MKSLRVSAFVYVTLFSALLASCHGGSSSNVLPATRGVPIHKFSAGDYAAAVQADHPIQYFQLTETSGPTAVDSSSTAVNGTYVGAVTFGVTGPLLDEPSTGISLPGGTASVGVSLPNPNAVAGTSYSIVTWVNPTLGSDYITIWGYNGTHRLLVSSAGRLLSQFSGNFMSKNTLSTNHWHQVVFVYNAQTSTESYYIDGALDNSATLSTSAGAFVSAYYLGQYSSTAAYYKWHGSLGQHAFFNSALSSSQIATLYSTAGYGGGQPPPPTPTPPPPASPSPSASTGNYASAVLGDTPSQYFKLTETAGPTAVDSSSTAVNGTYVGSITYGVAGPLRDESSTAISLPGGTASVGVSLPNPNATSGKSYSIATWVNPILGSDYMTIWGYDGAHRLLVSSSGALLSQFSGGFHSKSALTSGQWHFIVFVYNAQTATESYYIDGAFDSSAALSNSAAAFVSAYYLGQYSSTSAYYKWHGSLGQHAFFFSALSASQIANLYAAAGYGSGAPTQSPTPSPTPSPIPSYTDWSTYGDGLARTNYNPNETTLNSSNVSQLHLAWSDDLGAAITAQPIVATNISINNTPTTVLYVGTEGGVFYALNADTGTTIWSKQLAPSVTSTCKDLPGGTFGITDTATYDKTRNLVYVADAQAQVHALDMSTGTEAAGWPATVVSDYTKDHVYSALTLNPANGLLYAMTAGYCDQQTYHGTIVAINTSSASVAYTFVPSTPYSGVGMWGVGGAAVDSSSNIYVTTGNTIGSTNENDAYGDQALQLSAQLQVLAAAKPPLYNTDSDFGATPMLYQPGACPALVVAKQKSGRLYTWNESNLAAAPVQALQMAAASSSGAFIGVTAYSPVTNLVYVGNPLGNVAPYTHGVSALSVQSDCTLSLNWQQTAGPQAGDDNDSPTVANGVVYLAEGLGKQVAAYDAASGQQLWTSGTIIGGSVMTSPTVDGRLYVSAWDHKLYAFSL